MSVQPDPAKAPKVEKHDPYAALRHRSFALYLVGNSLNVTGRQMLGVAVTWQIYEWTKSAAALGLLGLLYAIPLLTLTLPAGHLADRANRKGVLTIATAVQILISLALAAVSAFPEAVPDLAPLRAANAGLRTVVEWAEHTAPGELAAFDRPALPVIFLLLFLGAIARVASGPSRTALLPQLLPLRDFSNAVTWNSSAFEITGVAGPALGGFAVAWLGFSFVYTFDALTSAFFVVLLGMVRPHRSATPRFREPVSGRGWTAGLQFIWTRKVILAAVTLDLFAVLLGGVTALLPVFADRVLGVGAIGLGWLRAAPAVGAFAMALTQAHLPPLRRPGLVLLCAVGIYGVTLIAFGLSPWFWLSLALLVLSGSADNISVIMRHSLVQLLTPDEKRGRVSAVNQVFVGSSNELGALRAGFMAAWLGPVVATVVGGIGTVLVVIGVARLWPEIKRLEPLHRLKPE